MDRFSAYATTFGFDPTLVDMCREAASASIAALDRIERVKTQNQLRVLAAFREAKIGDQHLIGSTGYGYGDIAREALGDVYASAFQAEAGLVVPHLVSGTHAIAACLFGLLRPGDELVYATGTPYDTLREVIGLERKVPGSLADFQVDCTVVPCKPNGAINLENLLRALSPRTKVVAFQRSCGYEWSLSRSVGQLQEAYAAVKRVRPDICCFTDNCYGEFVEDQEPTAVGCDLMAGSLIKNPGGGLAPTGGYIVGRREYVELAATRVTAPGIGGHVGATLDLPRLLLQGFYLAPHFVAEALAGTEVAGRLLHMAGFEINPAPGSQRTDLVVAVRMRSSEQLIAFCQGLQRACPVNGHVRPEASEMPGYDSQVIMAGGSFIQGATLEFSADAPIREPYTVYIQGGLTREQAELGILAGLENLRQMGLSRA